MPSSDIDAASLLLSLPWRHRSFSPEERLKEADYVLLCPIFMVSRPFLECQATEYREYRGGYRTRIDRRKEAT